MPDTDPNAARPPVELSGTAGLDAPTADYAPAAPGWRAVLEVTDGPHRGARFEFDRHATFVIGRAKSAHLELGDDPYFSRHHALVEFQPPRAMLRDLGSRNGTRVNGERVAAAELKDGDEIGGGRTRIRVRLEAPPEPARCLACGGPTAYTLCPACREQARARPQPVPGYELLREVGRGAMGVVHLARHIATGRAVALKLVIPESAASPRTVPLFLREVSVLSRLDHPRIVKFHEVGSAAGQFFFAMEYVETVDLAALLAGQAPEAATRTACGVVCQALEGLGHAHEQGFVHRDVKPSNLLVSRAGKRLRVKVADFGLAKNFEGAGFSGMTRVGDIRGSLAYMPPEQVMDCRLAKPAADLFSAAATLYALLAKTSPHRFRPGRDPYAAILEDELAPLAEHRPDLPPGLCAVIHQALARDPAARFASAKEMYRALLPFAKERP